jgi:phosphate-selective porin OprO/OprP
MRDFDSTTDEYVTLLDAVLGIPLWGEYGRMQIGKMKEPISMERTMGMIFEQVMERPMHLDALLPSRNTGITFSDMLLDGRMRWRVGIFNDWLSKDDVGFNDSDYQIIGRVTAVPYEDSSELALLHLGAAYRYERAKEGSVRYDVGPEFYFSSPWLDTGEIIADTTHTLNAEVTYLKGPLWIASEYSATIVEHNGERRNHFYGYHIAANYFVTGEHRGYNKRRGTVRRITPVLDFTKGGWGALELSARYSYMDLEDRDIHGGKMDSIALGMVWHPRRDHQFHLQWSRAKLEQHTSTPEVNAGESKTDILQLRWVWVID